MYRVCYTLLFAGALGALADINVGTNVKLNVPRSLPLDATSALDSALGSLSIELSCESAVSFTFIHRRSLAERREREKRTRLISNMYVDFSDFAGNLSHPNVLFAKAIDNLYQRTGQHPAIRPGGITADSAWFKADATLAIQRDLSSVRAWPL